MLRFVGGARAISALVFVFVGGEGPVQKPVTNSHAPVVAASTLPRLRRAWSINATNLTTTQWGYEETSPASDGALIAWGAGQGGSDLVAIELATGKERWRVAAPQGTGAQIE